ncbi:dATP pyrophosphohydrolase [Fodinibius salinus]|uniref:dATP pyrophosphohydrolase n=1 Tax=Fodinibius salinus TaxID=860790 RepID=A0A5D3YQ76_9BACT|nr:NUDIX domain-containing protein [Fodinibius salinus]TYP95199.1 dATP pyrophosphohydrolase [Fodinibius salinus]
MSRLVDVYPYSIEKDQIQFLVLKRSADVRYAGQWRMVGGKVKENEEATDAAIRELKEETGLSPDIFWTIPSINQFYDQQSDTIHHIPAFGAQVNHSEQLSLNHEHREWQWVLEDDVEDYIKWPEQRRLMNLLANIVTDNEILDAWINKQ